MTKSLNLRVKNSKKYMKKTIISIILVLFSVLSFGKDNGTLKFLGIPIDGSESQFATKLKEKGFYYNSASQSFKGQFNGQQVDVLIHTNHNIVDRICVVFPFTSETNVKLAYNHLLEQLSSSSKYTDLSVNESIPEDEKISYQILVNKKRYQASFCYFNQERDKDEFLNALLDKFSGILTPEQLAQAREYYNNSMNEQESGQQELFAQISAKLQEIEDNPKETDKEKVDQISKILFKFMEGMYSLADGDVWFMIHEQYGSYQIVLYYDNRHNQANGEDL